MSKKLFNSDQEGLIADLMRIVINKDPLKASSAKGLLKNKAAHKPNFFDLLRPTSLYLDFWKFYLKSLFTHGKPSNKSNKKLKPKLKRRTEIRGSKRFWDINRHQWI